MSDSETESVPPSERSEQRLEMLERFEKHRRSWELELLISGAVVFALLGIPGRLDSWFFGLDLHVAREQFMVVFFAYYYLKLIAFALIATFCFNLIARAYWIGLIGLHKVFPEGVRWSEVKDGPISRPISQKLPDLPTLIDRTDKVSSLIFSSAFLIIFIFVFSIVAIVAISLPAWGISTVVFDGRHMEPILYGLLALLFLPAMFCGLFDKALAKKPREAWEGRWFVGPMRKIFNVFNWISLRPLSGTVQLTLSSNIDKKIAVPVSTISFVGLLLLFLVTFLAQKSDRMLIHGYRYFPDVRVERQVDFSHYESLQPPGEAFVVSPSIQSDILDEPFVRLFIPYSPFKHNRKLVKLCPEVEPMPQQGLSFKKARNRDRPSDAAVDAALGCLASLHQVSLNGEKLSPTFDFYTHPDTGVRGIVTYIATETLPRGRNELHIEQVRVLDDDPSEKERRTIEYFIPFWK